MPLNWTKTAEGDTEVADLISSDGRPVEVLQVLLEWEQPGRTGFLGRFKPTTDIDVSAIIFCGSEDVDYVSPKEHPRALSGAVIHHGDVVAGQGEGGGERITMKLAELRADDDDITAIALTASCAKGGFNKIAGAVCRIYDMQPVGPAHLGNVRFSVSENHTGALLGVVKKTDTGWTFTKTKQYGPGGDWRTLAHLARGHV